MFLADTISIVYACKIWARQPKSPDALPMAPAALMSIGPLRRERGENNNETIAGPFRVTILPYPSSKDWHILSATLKHHGRAHSILDEGGRLLGSAEKGAARSAHVIWI